MFTGRDKEIAFLESWYQSDSGNIIIIHGRPGCGKTELLKEFAKTVPHFYYAVRECTEDMQLRFFCRQLYMGSEAVRMDWDTAFAAIPPQALILLDDFQHMAKSPQVMEMIQKLGVGRKLIICADSKLDIDADELPLKSMPFYDAIGFFPRYAPFDQMALYAAFGGMPKHLSYIDTALSMEQNIKQKLLNCRAPLFYETETMMKRDLREAAVYNTITAEIAAGRTKIAQLHETTGIGKTKLSVYLKNLVNSGLLEREVPISPAGSLSTNAAWGQYGIPSHLARFWFTFVFPNLSDLLWGNIDEVYRYKIAPNLDAYVARAFSEICMDYLKAGNDRGLLPFRFTDIGRWWRGGLSLDILATGEDGGYLMGLCRYLTGKMTMPEYQKATARFDSIDPDRAGFRYLFCNTGFTDEVRGKALKDKITLIGLYGRVL